jgi:hypothetical protein
MEIGRQRVLSAVGMRTPLSRCQPTNSVGACV